MYKPSRVITIAGSASGGSAGIQADLKTFQELDVYGMSVITAIVARHPETDKNVHPQTMEAIEAQFDTAMKQVGTDAIKVGMLFTAEVIERVAELIERSEVKHVVVDPVMVGKLDSKLLRDDAIDMLIERLLPLATVITPNMPEASILLGGRELTSVEDLKQAAIDLYEKTGQKALVKGGRLSGPAVDVLYDGETLTSFEAPRIETKHTSGAGCSYASAITAYLAKGETVPSAIRLAKDFVTTAIEHGFSYTNFVGPTYHAAMRL
ncbi:MAG TPA: bifunctional hydroxymethylpyrimidine kinase/phosphomethylpyrimidine kinase, partial [Bacillota bacterium]|nr:bifunctional hydroxymethylpyrimidine kinase/phosphomethylpyrimidine kinase [Bacillota bacterium]